MIDPATEGEGRRRFLKRAAGLVGLPPVLWPAGCARSMNESVESVSAQDILTDQPPGEIPQVRQKGEPVPPSADHPGAEAARSQSSDLLAVPDLSHDRILRFVAGIRPYRRGGIRIEREHVAGKTIIHNYGHGGAGVTLSWGSAAEVVRLLADVPPSRPVAVLGAGVIGLTTAHELLRRGHAVSIHASAFTPHTTSDIAGAQWAPSLVSSASPSSDRGRFERIVRASYRRFRGLEGSAWGVYSRPNYQTGSSGAGLEKIPDDLVPEVRVPRLPWPGRDRSGSVYHTMLIEPPQFLPRLFGEVRGMGARIEQRTFRSLEEVSALSEDVIVNCLGLGAKDVCRDASMIPVRGQLVHMQPQDLPWLLSHSGGYIFPRHDAVLLGGTMERGRTDPTPSEATCRAIIARHRRFFA